MGAIKSMAQARAMQTARDILHGGTRARGFIWRRNIRFIEGNPYKRAVCIELLPNFELRVTVPKTGEILAQGPAWVEPSR